MVQLEGPLMFEVFLDGDGLNERYSQPELRAISETFLNFMQNNMPFEGYHYTLSSVT